MKNDATLLQAKQLLEILETLDCAQIQRLIASGLLTDLRRCATELDLNRIDRNRVRRALGLYPTLFRVKMGGPEDTDQIVKALNFLECDPRITQENFPLAVGDVLAEDEIEIVDLNLRPDNLEENGFYEREGLDFLKAKSLDRPTYAHAIRFAAQYGKVTTSERKANIMFLHDPWEGTRDQRGRYVLSLCRLADFQGRKFQLVHPESAIHGSYVLAGVRRKR